eukprot:scaffold359_cov351-Pinguiococcus_pyrenoidosus.AAC.2
MAFHTWPFEHLKRMNGHVPSCKHGSAASGASHGCALGSRSARPPPMVYTSTAPGFGFGDDDESRKRRSRIM